VVCACCHGFLTGTKSTFWTPSPSSSSSRTRVCSLGSFRAVRFLSGTPWREGSMGQRQLRRERGKSPACGETLHVHGGLLRRGRFIRLSFVFVRYDLENSMDQWGRRERQMSGSFRRPIESKRKAEATRVHVVSTCRLPSGLPAGSSSSGIWPGVRFLKRPKSR